METTKTIIIIGLIGLIIIMCIVGVDGSSRNKQCGEYDHRSYELGTISQSCYNEQKQKEMLMELDFRNMRK